MVHVHVPFLVLLFSSGFLPLATALCSSSSFSFYPSSVIEWLDSEGISYRHYDNSNSNRNSNSDNSCHPFQAFSSRTRNPLLHIFYYPSDSGKAYDEEDPRSGVWLHILPSPNHKQRSEDPTCNYDMTNFATDRGLGLIHLHQDVWSSKPNIVQSRLLARLGNTKTRLFARKTTVKRIRASLALPFLKEHHLWSATKAKYYYGLFHNNNNKSNNNKSNNAEEELVAVASFSSRRKVVRCGIPHRSHELIRFCSRRDGNVVGGITKLIQAFVREHNPDDIVTVVDRDWGSGNGWYSLGFQSVHVMPPLPMVVGVEDGVRRHLVGAGIRHSHNTTAIQIEQDCNNNNGRIGLEPHVLKELEGSHDYKQSVQFLEEHGYCPVYDAGVERMFKIIDTQKEKARNEQETQQSSSSSVTHTSTELWEHSVPQYASTYYSMNAGIAAMLRHAEQQTL